ncbi:class I SAM-dependent methyltransferase [Microvirga yunnanensis]|uniref:class I SAM-dependent methyltransferase n=1 Tax=Microvirga yunnanensis TaxID=2953740 RepID=UPI0021C6B81D|nr:methyltransferase domain-containing protein [Microvirga sp. HBU65207]
MGRWSRRVGDVFVDWIQVPSGLRWLDIGCGTGVFTEQVIRCCAPAAVVGLDPSAEQLAFARGRGELSKVEFHVGDAQDLPFLDNSFDIAVMALVIHFVPDPAKAAAEMGRVLRPGGTAAAYVWDYKNAGSPTSPLAAAMKAMGLQSPAPPSPQVTSLAALEELWRAAGFVQIGTRTIEIVVEFRDFEEFWQSMTVPVGPAGKAISAMSPDRRAQLRSVLEQQMPVTAGGTVTYEARASAVKGRKRA